MLIVGLAGLHNSGKSYWMNKSAEELERKGFSVLKVGGRRAVRKRVKDERNVVERQTLMLTETIRELISIRNNPENKDKIIFVERDLWDWIAFSEGSIKANLASRQDLKYLLGLAKEKTEYIDLAILILISEETSIKRRKKEYILDPVVGEHLSDFKRAYQALEGRLPKGSIVLSGEDERFDENFGRVLKLITSRIGRRPNEALKN